ncbi:uncharacterized protein LOC141630271 [Silene latifolia]|uniref:uncharacterized protein LOC141630271 n=1 Tax=Silene latifolia TaxID=37657 RepID=UPI003D77C26D
MKGADWSTYQPPLDSNWNWRNICKVKDIMQNGYLNNCWIGDPKGYSIRSGYSWLQGQHPPVQWYQAVWDTWCVPKHSFIGWLIHHGALNTREKLFSIGVAETKQCVICERDVETHAHLFGLCEYSSRILKGVECWLQIGLVGPQTGSVLQRHVCHMAKMACWYYIWMERNCCRLEGVLTRPELVCTDVQRIIRARIQQLLPSRGWASL